MATNKKKSQSSDSRSQSAGSRSSSQNREESARAAPSGRESSSASGKGSASSKQPSSRALSGNRPSPSVRGEGRESRVGAGQADERRSGHREEGNSSPGAMGREESGRGVASGRGGRDESRNEGPRGSQFRSQFGSEFEEEQESDTVLRSPEFSEEDEDFKQERFGS